MQGGKSGLTQLLENQGFAHSSVIFPCVPLATFAMSPRQVVTNFWIITLVTASSRNWKISYAEVPTRWNIIAQPTAKHKGKTWFAWKDAARPPACRAG